MKQIEDLTEFHKSQIAQMTPDEVASYWLLGIFNTEDVRKFLEIKSKKTMAEFTDKEYFGGER